MGNLAFQKLINFNSLSCSQCGIWFALDQEKYRRCKENGEDFYCSNGHVLIFTTNEVSKLKKRLEWAEKNRDNANNRAGRAERSNTALKGVITRTKKRIGAGTCPCCKRTFQQLSRHMNNKHPNYGSEKIKL